MYSERQLIRKLCRQFRTVNAVAGIGDDAAILDPPSGHSLLFCSDLLVENTHFRRHTHPAEAIGFKALAVNVSDIGAMGGVPSCCVLSLAVPSDTTADWIDRLFDGVTRACRAFDLELVGGDTSSSEQIFLDVAMLGWVEPGQALRRDGAKPGHGIYVTGSLGASAHGLQLLEKGDVEHPAVKRHLYPTPRNDVGKEVGGLVTAMTDISDGLSTDLSHILESSQVSARIYASSVPLAEGVSLDLALHGGEDYELLMTATAALPPQVRGIRVTRIGEIIESAGTHQAWIVSESEERLLEPSGWNHFS